MVGVIIDSHVHVMPDFVREDREAIASSEPWFAACHPPGKALISAEQLIRKMDQDGVGLTFCFTWPFANQELCRRSNDYIARAAARFPERIVGFGIVNPAAPGAADEVVRCATLGLAGIGELNADAQGWTFDGDAISDVVGAARTHNMLINLHVSEPVGHDFAGRGTSFPTRLLTWVDRFGDVPTIASHLGGGLPFYARVPQVADACQKLWFDTSAMPFLYTPVALRAVLDACGPDRVLYGSDFPLLELARYHRLFSAAELGDSDTAALLGGNARQLLERFRPKLAACSHLRP